MIRTLLRTREAATVAAWAAVTGSFLLGAPLAVSLVLGVVFAVTGFRMMHPPVQGPTGTGLSTEFTGRHVGAYDPAGDAAGVAA